ncbi:MAG: hypothetical protein KDK34_06000 [Leptospiraceae bacterium]|nr:hypothetical protein [Leptospiraceae bacterium]
MFAPTDIITMIVFLLLMGIAFWMRRRKFQAVLRLDQLNRQKYQSEFQRYEMMQTGVYMLILAPMIVIGWWSDAMSKNGQMILLALSFFLTALWLTMGYNMMERKLKELNLPEDFIRAHMAERWTLIALLLILLVFSYNTMYGLS